MFVSNGWSREHIVSQGKISGLSVPFAFEDVPICLIVILGESFRYDFSMWHWFLKKKPSQKEGLMLIVIETDILGVSHL